MRSAAVAVRRFIQNAVGKQEGVVTLPAAPTAGVMPLKAAPVKCRSFFASALSSVCVCCVYSLSLSLSLSTNLFRFVIC